MASARAMRVVGMVLVGICARVGLGQTAPATQPVRVEAVAVSGHTLRLRVEFGEGRKQTSLFVMPDARGAGEAVKEGTFTGVKNAAGTGGPEYWSKAGYGGLALGEDDNAPARWTRDAGSGKITWRVPGKTVDLYLMPAAGLEEAERNYAELTGRPPVPPRWAFGYMQ